MCQLILAGVQRFGNAAYHTGIGLLQNHMVEIFDSGLKFLKQSAGRRNNMLLVTIITGKAWLIFFDKITVRTPPAVDNIGGVAFESVQITIEDLTAVVVLYGPGTNNSPFLGSSGDCPPQASALAPGGAAYIAANIAGYISGNTARETLTMCTQDGLGGDCITKSVDFVLP